ncbi:hypothetical protein [Actinomadura sp. GTD37]|uniref:hypothetical protein n=1 Tax=Actinomadura sp. GTD37 TaxID=1778030 RepID=UPI0035C0FF34
MISGRACFRGGGPAAAAALLEGTGAPVDVLEQWRQDVDRFPSFVARLVPPTGAYRTRRLRRIGDFR